MDCSVCREKFDDPRVLPCCGHSACLGCLQLTVKPEDTTLSCPTCHTTCQIPEGGITILPKNLILDAVQELADSKTTPTASTVLEIDSAGPKKPKTPRCSNWAIDNPHAVAVAFCLQCAEYFCRPCQSGHRNYRAMRDHALVGIDDLEADQIQRAMAHVDAPCCDRHPMDKISMYCSNCQVPICTPCSAGPHKWHDTESLSEAAIKCKFSLNNIRHSAYAYLVQVQMMRNDLVSTGGHVRAHCEKGRQYVRESTRQVIKLAQDQERQLIEEINRCEERAAKEIDTNINHYDSQVSEANRLLAKTDILHTDYTVTVHTQGLARELDEVKETKLDSVEWQCTMATAKAETLPSSELVGKVDVASIPKVSKKAIKSFLIDVEDKYGGTYPTGMAMVHGCLVIVQNKDPYLWVYNADGVLKRKELVPELSDPQGMALVSAANSQLAISDYEKGKLHLITLQGDHTIDAHKRVSLGRCHPRDIQMDEKTGNLAIATEGDKHFLITDVKGRVKVGGRLPGVHSVRSLVTRNGGGYIILDSSATSPRSLMWFSKTGIMRGIMQRSYLGPSSRDSLGVCWNVVRDSLGRILVTDGGKNRIHLLSDEGKFISFLLGPEHDIVNPTCIHLDEKARHLYVAHGLKRARKIVSLYEYNSLPVTASTFYLKLVANSF